MSPYTVPWGDGYRISGGVVWAEDSLYYVSAKLELMCYRLSDGESVSLGSIPFMPQATKDQYYDKNYDGVSLLFDKHSGVLSALSRNRKITLKTWQIALPQMDFEDITPKDFFFRQVRWAVEKGVSIGLEMPF